MAAEKSSWVARAGLVLALFGVGLSLYQCAAGERNTKIQAAIELSTKDISDTGIVRMKTDALDWFNNRAAYGSVDPQTVAAETQVLYLDYVAQLINSGRATETYISLLLKCELINIYRNLYVNDDKPDKNLPLKDQVVNLSEFYKRHQGIECRLVSRR